MRFGDGTLPNSVDPPRPDDVLDLLLAEIRVGVIDPVSHLVSDDTADADPSCLGKGLQPRRDVHPIAEDILALSNDISEVDPDAELDPPPLRSGRIALSHSPLHLDPAADRIHHTGEFREHSIAGSLDDAPAVLLDLRINQFPEMRSEPRVRAFLVCSHQARITGDISGENGC